MNLNRFLSDLLVEGKVILRPGAGHADPSDREEALRFLREAWQHESANLPEPTPEFHPEAALWAANYLMNALMIALDRNQGAEVIETTLKKFQGEKSLAAIISADLCLRHLPRVLDFARSLAPDDPLVLNLKISLNEWPYSGIGWRKRETVPEFPEETALQRIWLDRIILRKDGKLLENETVREQIAEDLGTHGSIFWPEFGDLAPKKTESTQHE